MGGGGVKKINKKLKYNIYIELFMSADNDFKNNNNKKNISINRIKL